jgi:hypothetical protein
MGKSPRHAADSRNIAETILAPLGGLDRTLLLPTAYAVGYILSPLRGYWNLLRVGG